MRAYTFLWDSSVSIITIYSKITSYLPQRSPCFGFLKKEVMELWRFIFLKESQQQQKNYVLRYFEKYFPQAESYFKTYVFETHIALFLFIFGLYYSEIIQNLWLPLFCKFLAITEVVN